MAHDAWQWVVVRQFGGLYEVLAALAPLEPQAGQAMATELTDCYPGPGGMGLLPAWKHTTIPALPAGLEPASGLFVDWPIVAAGVVQDLWIGASVTGSLDSFRFYRMKDSLNPASSWQLYHTHTVAAAGRAPRCDFTHYRPSLANSPQPVHVAANNWRNGLGYIHEFPDPASPTTDSTLLVRSANVDGLIAHNQRLVWMEDRTASHTSGRNAGDANALLWTDQGSNTVAATNYAILSAASIGAFGFMASVDVADLLIVKIDSAYLIQGDLSAPRMLRLPNVPGGIQQKPAVTPWGVIWGTLEGGLVTWTGGAGADDLAPMLRPNFWSGNQYGYYGAHDYIGHFLFVPNGYVWDARTKSWFKHSELATARLFASDHGQVMYSCDVGNVVRIGSPGEFTGGRMSSWSWTSAPLAPPGYRPFEIREVQLVVRTWDASTACTYTVTVGSESYPVTVAGSNSDQLVRIAFHQHADTLSVRVQAASSGAAGLLREVRVGYRPATQVPGS